MNAIDTNSRQFGIVLIVTLSLIAGASSILFAATPVGPLALLGMIGMVASLTTGTWFVFLRNR